MASLKIKKGDIVRVIAGKDSKTEDGPNGTLIGKEGKVLAVDMKNHKILVEGVNIVTKHAKPSQANPEGGRIEKEAPLDISNVMLVVKGQPTRVGFKMEGGKKVRYAKKTGEVID